MKQPLQDPMNRTFRKQQQVEPEWTAPDFGERDIDHVADQIARGLLVVRPLGPSDAYVFHSGMPDRTLILACLYVARREAPGRVPHSTVPPKTVGGQTRTRVVFKSPVFR